MTDVLDELRGFCHGKTETVYTRAVDEIERLREAARWIPVGERLPKVGDCVIVRHMRKCGKDGHLAEAVCEAEFYHLSDRMIGFAGQYCDDLKVTHWRPMPDATL
jgi:hypothetical protein